MKATIDWQRVRSSKAKRRGSDNRRPVVTQKTVAVSLLDTYHKVGEARHFRIESDEPIAVGGRNLAPQPTEFMLMSLAFCQMSIIVGCAATMRLVVDDIRITVTASRDDRGLRGVAGIRPGYSDIQMKTTLVSEETSDRLRRLAMTAEGRCPVFDNLRNATPIQNRVIRNGETIWEQ